MSSEATEPTEPTAANNLEDDIVAMFEEALAQTSEATTSDRRDAAAGDT
jgi:hypothetical protein